MMEKFVYEYAIEAILNEGLDDVAERWNCPLCGNSFLKISCAKPHLRQDLLLRNDHGGQGWKISNIVYPEFNIESSCECEPDKPHLKIVPTS
jgi:hypothetical protein